MKIRQKKANPVFDDLEAWLNAQLPKISAKTPLASAIRYALTRIKRLRPYLENGVLDLDNNTAERSIRPIALGRKNYLFMGSQGGGKSAAIAYTLIETAKLNGVDPQAWLTDVLGPGVTLRTERNGRSASVVGRLSRTLTFCERQSEIIRLLSRD